MTIIKHAVDLLEKLAFERIFFINVIQRSEKALLYLGNGANITLKRKKPFLLSLKTSIQKVPQANLSQTTFAFLKIFSNPTHWTIVPPLNQESKLHTQS